MRRNAAFCILALGVLIACSKGDEHTVTRAAIDTLPGGAVRVRNDGPTMWPDTSGWRIVLVVERTFSASGPGAMEHPNFPTPLADGGVVVVNQKPIYLARYSPALEPLGRFSREGSGPGEFLSPLPISARDSIFVLDQNRSVIAAFDREGHYASETTIRCCVHDIGNVDHDRVAVSGSFGHQDLTMLWWDLATNRAVDSVVPPPGPKAIIVKRCSFGLPYQPQEAIAAVTPGHAWWGVSDDDRFILTRTGADTTIITSSTRPRVAVSDSALDKMFGPGSFVTKMCGPLPERSQVPKVKPAWKDIFADDAGNLWVYRSGTSHSSFDVYGTDGRRLGAVPDPFRGDENWWWHGDRVASVSEHDDGSFTLRVYRIDRTKQ